MPGARHCYSTNKGVDSHPPCAFLSPLLSAAAASCNQKTYTHSLVVQPHPTYLGCFADKSSDRYALQRVWQLRFVLTMTFAQPQALPTMFMSLALSYNTLRYEVAYAWFALFFVESAPWVLRHTNFRSALLAGRVMTEAGSTSPTTALSAEVREHGRRLLLPYASTMPYLALHVGGPGLQVVLFHVVHMTGGFHSSLAGMRWASLGVAGCFYTSASIPNPLFLYSALYYPPGRDWAPTRMSCTCVSSFSGRNTREQVQLSPVSFLVVV